MKSVSVILMVLFYFVSILLILLVAAQDDGGEGAGSVFGMSAREGSIFGAQTNSVVTKITAFLAIMFLVLSLSLTFINKSGSKDTLTKRAEAEASSTTVQEEENNWFSNKEVPQAETSI